MAKKEEKEVKVEAKKKEEKKYGQPLGKRFGEADGKKFGEA